MKPYKVKNDLWFYPVKSKNVPDFTGIYFQYPFYMNEIFKNYTTDYSNVDDVVAADPKMWALMQSTVFVDNERGYEYCKSFGFQHVYNIENFNNDTWEMAGMKLEVSTFFRVQYGDTIGCGVRLSGDELGKYKPLIISCSFTKYNGGFLGVPKYENPNDSDMEVARLSVGRHINNDQLTIFLLRGHTYRGDGIDIGEYPQISYGSTEIFEKFWWDVVEAPSEIPKDTFRVYKDIYLQNGAQITKAESNSEPLPPAHQVSGDLWVLPCRQILDDGTEAVSDIYYQYPFKEHRYYDYDNDPFEVSDVSEYGDPTFSQCTVFTGMVKQYYGWNGLRLNSVKLRIKDTVVSLESYSAHYSRSLRAKRPTDTNYHMIARYPNMQMRVSGSTLFVKLSDTVICGSAYDGAINSDGSVSKARLIKNEITIPDDEESRDFYNWLFDDRYIYNPPLKGIKTYKDIFLMGGAKILIDKKTENLKEAHRIRNDLWKLPCEVDGAEVAPNADGTRRPVEKIFFQYPYKRLGIAQFNKADEITDNEFVNCTFFSDYAYPGAMRDRYKFPNCVRVDWRGTWKIKDVENIQGSIYKGENVSLYTEYWGEEKQITLYYYGLKRPNDTEIHPIAVWISGRYVLGSPYVGVGSLLVPVSQTMLHGTHFFNISSSASTVTPFYSFEINLEYNDVDGFYNWLFNGVFNAEEETTRLKIYKDIILMNGAKIYNEDGTEYTIES